MQENLTNEEQIESTNDTTQNQDTNDNISVSSGQSEENTTNPEETVENTNNSPTEESGTSGVTPNHENTEVSTTSTTIEQKLDTIIELEKLKTTNSLVFTGLIVGTVVLYILYKFICKCFEF